MQKMILRQFREARVLCFPPLFLFPTEDRLLLCYETLEFT